MPNQEHYLEDNQYWRYAVHCTVLFYDKIIYKGLLRWISAI